MLAAVPNTEWTATSVARVYSDPFGGIRGSTDADVPGDHRFLGATRDADSGLTLLGARYYDPVTGCFISVDPILNLEVPAHLHAYAYGFNNPVTFSDASGLEPRDKNGNFDGDPYSSPSTTSWAYLNGCGVNLSCVGTWVGQNTLHYYGGLAEGVSGLLFMSCSLCMGAMGAFSTVTALSDWDAHLASEQAKGEQFREWWSDPWNNFWRPIGEDWANDPGHAWSGTVVTAGTLLVPGGGLIKLGTAARTASAASGAAAGASSIAASGSSFGGLQFAARFGIKPYNKLIKDLSGTGLQAHHLLEQRFAAVLGVNARSMLAVAVTPAEHQVFTNAWRAAIPYGAGTRSATAESVSAAAAKIYESYPGILEKLGLQ